MEVSVINNSVEPWLLSLTARELAGALGVMSRAMTPAAPGQRPRALELNLLDDADMAGLNGDFLGLCGPTNVLSFPSTDTGSLALAVQTVSREAWLYGRSAPAYTLRMLAHGLAHILGYEHGEDMDIEVEKAVRQAAASLITDGKNLK